MTTINQDCQISLDRLAAFVQGYLPAAQHAEVQTHLDLGCEKCARSTTWLRRVADVSASDRSVEPAETLIQRALHIFPRPAPTRSLRQRIPAILIFDSFKAPAALGVRAATLHRRQYLYRSNDIDINLHIQPLETHYVALVGQILPGGDALDSLMGIRVQLSVDAAVKAEGATNEVGEFTLSHLRHGLYDFSIYLQDHDLVIEGLEV